MYLGWETIQAPRVVGVVHELVFPPSQENIQNKGPVIYMDPHLPKIPPYQLQAPGIWQTFLTRLQETPPDPVHMRKVQCGHLSIAQITE